MKRLREPPRRAPLDSALPMINLVFLLLAFFVATAVIAPPDALETSPPAASGGEAQSAANLVFLDADGVFAWREHRDDAAFAALAAYFNTSGVPEITLLADASADAAQLMATLDRLRAAGAKQLFLSVRQGASDTEARP